MFSPADFWGAPLSWSSFLAAAELGFSRRLAAVEGGKGAEKNVKGWRKIAGVKLAYGQEGLTVDLPPMQWLFSRKHSLLGLMRQGRWRRPFADPIGAPPIEKLAAGKTVCVVTSDLTRPSPTNPFSSALLPALKRAGARSIKILIATGLHRPNTREELCSMFGQEIVAKYEIVNHLAKEKKELAFIGNLSDGAPLWGNRHYLEAECRILTGFIEPHFFAGFSGGRKAILPGIAGEESIRANHQALFINHPKATFGELEGNPVHQQMLEAAKMAGVDFIVNVATGDHRITGVFAGDLEEAHKAGVDFVREKLYGCIARALRSGDQQPTAAIPWI